MLGLKKFLQSVLSALQRVITTPNSKIPEATKTDLISQLTDMTSQVSRGTAKIEEQTKILNNIVRQLDEAEAPRRGAQIRDITKDSPLDEILQDLAERAGTSPDKARTALVNRANEGYAPNDPKRMRFDDDKTLEAYAQSKIQTGAKDELLEDVIDAASKDEMMKKMSMSPDEFKDMIGPGRPKSIYDEIAEDEMLPFGRSGEADKPNTPGTPLGSRDDLEFTKFSTDDDDLMSGIARAEKALRQKDIDLEKVEELMMNPENFGKSIDELMQEVQDDKVIPFIKYKPNPKPKKAKGGRIHAQGGGLGLPLKALGMRAPDKIADVKQMKNVVRSSETDLTRLPDTPKNRPTIDEVEQMVIDDPRYKGKTQSEMLMKIDKEKIRADVAYNMNVEPKEIPDDVVDMLYQEGYHLKFANGGAVGVGSLFKRKR